MIVIKSINPHWMLIIGLAVFPVERFIVVVAMLAVVVVVIVIFVVVVVLYIRIPLVPNKRCTSLVMVELLHIGLLHV
jgi:hypothetical protein